MKSKSSVRCDRCQKPLQKNIAVVVRDKILMPQCFLCHTCKRLVPDGADYFEVDDNATCAHCYYEKHGMICHRCGKPTNNQQIIRILDHEFHADCVRCFSCGQSFTKSESRSFYKIEDEPHCLKCSVMKSIFHGSGSKV